VSVHRSLEAASRARSPSPTKRGPLMHAVGIDIGGTKIAGALVAEDGQILRLDRIPTPAGDPSAIVDGVVAMITRLSEGQDVTAAGVAAAGFIDDQQSTVYYAPNISWRNEPFRDRLRA